MLKHGYIKNDFKVDKWAAPEFMEQAAKELLQDEWTTRSTTKLSKGTNLLKSSRKIG